MNAVTLAMVGALSGLVSVQTSVTTWLVFDPHSDNRLTIEEPASLGGPTGTRLVGGVRATLVFDATRVLLNLPVAVGVRIDEIRVAGESFAAIPILPDLQTGTTFARPRPRTDRRRRRTVRRSGAGTCRCAAVANGPT